MKNTIITLLCTAVTGFCYGQGPEFREEINLSGNTYKIYTKQEKNNNLEQTVYCIPNRADTIFHIALAQNVKTDKETFRGIYRENGQELHFIKFDLATNKMNHQVYTPNKEGRLVLIKENKGLDAYPQDLPPKFKDNKPLHPEFNGGQAALYGWVESNIYPILLQKHKKSTKGNAVMILEIDAKGQASLTEIKNITLSAELGKLIAEKLQEMPLWQTIIQGYNVSGVVFIPIDF